MALISPTQFDPTELSKSIATHPLYLDGQNQLNNAEIFKHRPGIGSTVTGFGVTMQNSRTAGTLTMTLKKNGSAISSLQIDNSNPLSNKVTGLSETITPSDTLTLEVSTTSFSPLDNTGEFYILDK